jgi:hypothetical protein
MQLTRKRTLALAAGALLLLALAAGLAQAPAAQAATAIFASPIHAGCYLARPDRCKIHVEPFTINIASSKKLAQFSLVAIKFPGSAQAVIYDWRPDQSNPVPVSGTTYTPSLVAKDFAATCGSTYEISLQGKDTGDTSTFNLGLTGQFTCPVGTYSQFIPLSRLH